jgi:(p)ppGpp synthase/HD superfamily hydrolase
VIGVAGRHNLDFKPHWKLAAALASAFFTPDSTSGSRNQRCIRRRAGEDVASLVEEVTDDKSLPKEVRKEEQVKTAPTKSSRAKLLKLADKTSNLRSIAASAPSDWSVKRRLEYVRWVRQVASGLRGVSQKLEDQFDQAAAAAERSFKPMM